MATRHANTVVQELRKARLLPDGDGWTDGELLERFVRARDPGALEALVRRHGAMVWGVCRRILNDHHDAEDAFQATFLVLVRKAASVVPRELLANWLYGVARQTALKARQTSSRRSAREKQMTHMPEPEVIEPKHASDLEVVLDEELSRLPDKNRAMIVLGDLEGKTREEAARQLAVAAGTVASRLARARAMLAKRLSRRGLTVSTAALTSLLAQQLADAAAPTLIVSSTIAATGLLASGQAATAVVRAKAASLMEGVVKTMLAHKLQKMMAMVLVLGLAALACGLLAAEHPNGNGDPPEHAPVAAQPPVKQAAAARGERRTPVDPPPEGALAQFGSPRLQDFTIDRAADFSPDGKLLATSGSNSPICIWDAATGKLVRTHPNRGSVFDLRWKADGKLRALTFFGHNVFLMQEFVEGKDADPDEETRLNREAGERRDSSNRARLDHCFLSADGQWAVAIKNSGTEPVQWAELFRFAAGKSSDTAMPESKVPLPSGYGVWVSPDARVLMAHALPTKTTGNKLVAFDLARDKTTPAWEIAYSGDDNRRPSVCLTPDGKRVVIMFWDETVELWDGPAGRRLREFPKLPFYYHRGNGEWGGIDLSPDGQRLALLPRDATGQAGGRILDLDTGKTLCTLTPQPMPRGFSVARFSADGKQLVRTAYGIARIWNAETGEDACPLPGHRGSVNSLAVLADLQTVVSSGADLTVRAWRPATGEEIWRTAVSQTVTVKFATADAVVVQDDVWGRDPVASCLDPRTGARRPLPGALGRAKEDCALAVAPDGKRVVSIEFKQRAFRVWSWPAGELLSTVPLAPAEPFQLSRCAQAQFTSDGKQLLAVMSYSHP